MPVFVSHYYALSLERCEVAGVSLWRPRAVVWAGYDIGSGSRVGTMLFMVIVLLGTGWSNLKPFLSDRERKVLVIILPLQVSAPPAVGVMKQLVSE